MTMMSLLIDAILNFNNKAMKVILNIKRHNKDTNGFSKEVDMTPQEYDLLKEVASEVNHRADNSCISVIVSEI